MDDILMQGTVIVGLGLIGSSFARAIKDVSPAYCVVGLDLMEDPVRKGLRDHVLNEGAVLGKEDEKTRQLIAGAGFVILSMYPEGILDFLDTYRDCFHQGQILIDICGLKGELVYEAQERMPEGVEYLATHPMAGKEKGGYENGDGEMFLGASFIITPTAKNNRETVEKVCAMAGKMGFGKIREVSPERHDEIIAYTSHLPHVIASSLISSWKGDEDIISFAGGSFRDATRVAEMNSGLWTELFIRNREPLLDSLGQYIETLQHVKDLLTVGDDTALNQMLSSASDRKIRWNRKVDRYDNGTSSH